MKSAREKRKSPTSADRPKKKRKASGKSNAEPIDGSADFWRELCPDLHVADAKFMNDAKPLELPPEDVARCRAALLKDGFLTLPPSMLDWAPSLKAMRVGVRRLIKRGWPASMLLVYDEAWVMAHQLSSLMAAVSGGCTNSLDTLAWSVTPSLGQSGFAPHRDRQPADVPGSFRADGTPKYATCWVALSAATTENSCMHMVPRGHDAGYDDGDDQSEDAEDPLIAVFRSSDLAVQSVRACPLKPGGCVIFSHRTMHWGSKGSDDCTDARISISYGFSDPSFEAPYFASPKDVLPYPQLSLRLALASAQQICYHERFDCPLALIRRFGATFRARRSAFTAEYAQKVAAELKAAIDDCRSRGNLAQRAAQHQAAVGAVSVSGGAHGGGAPAEDAGDDDDEEDAALDDALDAMLDAQMEADGNLYDDYDGGEVESD